MKRTLGSRPRVHRQIGLAVAILAGARVAAAARFARAAALTGLVVL